MARAPTPGHTWQFKSRFRRHAFGWRGSRPAIERIEEAVAEIKAVARTDPMLAADGAVAFLERVSPALEQIDSSSGAIGHAVNGAIVELVAIIAGAPAERQRREAWLDRLWAAHEADAIPYIEILADYWGDLCGSKEVASEWADRLVGITRMALSPEPKMRGHFHGTSACLSALFRAERYDEIVDVLERETFWHYAQWAVRALAARGEKAEAIRYAESLRGPWTPDGAVDLACEEILLSLGRSDEAYARFGRGANRRGTYLATFRAVANKYPHKRPSEILADLAADTPGEEGKWFAAAKQAPTLRPRFGTSTPESVRPENFAARREGFRHARACIRARSRAPRSALDGRGVRIRNQRPRCVRCIHAHDAGGRSQRHGGRDDSAYQDPCRGCSTGWNGPTSARTCVDDRRVTPDGVESTWRCSDV